MVRIRLKRMGRRHLPFYRINAIDKQTKRDGKVLENLGWYDPTASDAAKQLFLKTDRVKHWLEHGAQPSDTVMDMLSKVGLIDADKWKAERQTRVDAKKKREAKAAAAAEAAAAAAAAKKEAGEKKE